MSIIKNITNEKPFEVIPRELLQSCDKKRKDTDSKPLSLQAIGLLCNLQSYPEDWEIHKTELYNRYEKNGRRQIQNAWNELVDSNYIVQFKVYNGNKLDYFYYFSVYPITENQIKELEKKHNSESLKRLDLKEKNTTVQNEQYSNDGISSTVQNEQYNLYSKDLNSTKRTDNIIHNEDNTHEDNTHQNNIHYYTERSVKSSGSSYDDLFLRIQKEFNIKITPNYKKELELLFSSFSDDIIVYAIEYASNNADYPKKYMKSVLEYWKKGNVKTLDEAKKFTIKNNSSKSFTPAKSISIEQTPQWLLDKKNGKKNDKGQNEMTEEEKIAFKRKKEAVLKEVEAFWN